MFGIESSELAVIAVIALLVIGPRDLPRVMRMVGNWMAKGRAMTRHVRAGFDTMMREAELEEMQKVWAQQNDAIMKATSLPDLSIAPVDPVTDDWMMPGPDPAPAPEPAAASTVPPLDPDPPRPPRTVDLAKPDAATAAATKPRRPRTRSQPAGDDVTGTGDAPPRKRARKPMPQPQAGEP